MSNVWHPDDDLLIPWLDGELERAEATRVAQHVSGCGECTERLASLRDVNYELARIAPPPPAPWADLRSRLKELDAGQNAVRTRRSPAIRFDTKWVAVAAAVVIGAVVIHLSTGQTVSAAELLRDASAAEARIEPAKRIRVRTKRAVFTRPASGVVQSDVAALFTEAGYNWDEPLSARSFSGWRNKLSKKDDRVKILRDNDSRLYRITTSTEDGVLAEASITLRADDLRAIDSSFRFRNDEIVDITEEPVAGSGSAIPPERLAENDPAAPAKPAPPVREATVSDEMKVVAALHSIGADLGEPVEVKRAKHAIVVSALVTDPERQAQVRTALAGVPLVDLRFEQPEAVRGTERTAAPAGAPKSNALIERLTTRLGGRNTVENFTNHVMDLSEAALARAHALRSLADRFPSDVEQSLTEPDARVLASIEEDHAAKLLGSVRQLTELLKPLARTEASAAVPAYESWQSGSEVVLNAAQIVDKTLTNALAGSGEAENPDEALNRLARAAGDLNARVAALQTTLARSGAKR